MLSALRSCGITILAVCLFFSGGCAGGSSSPCLGLAPPTQSNPWYGTSGNVLISERGYESDGKIDCLWLGFNSSSNWRSFSMLRNQGRLGWIGGRVVVDAENPLGFYFDPNTTVAAEITAEGEQTSLGAIKQNPTYFAGFSWNWYVPAVTERVL